MTDNNIEEHEVYAIRYGSQPRQRSANFVGQDSLGVPMPLDCFVWLLRSASRTVLVDAGFSAATALARNRVLDRCSIDALRVLEVDPDTAVDVILTRRLFNRKLKVNNPAGQPAWCW